MPAPGAALDLLLDSIPAASGAVVMGTGIVSTALSLDGDETLSRILLVIAAGVWLALAWLLPARAWRDRARFRGERRMPAAFTGLAGSAVLGVRLTMLGWDWAGAGVLIIALVLWLLLVGPVLVNWTTPTVGASFMLTVGTESLGLLAATLALAHDADWLLRASLAPFVLGLAFYLLVLARFDFGQLATGLGDHWVTGGALAISTFTAARITLVSKHLSVLGGAVGALEAVSLALWALALLWLPALLLAEAYRRRLRYNARRWSTVFPVGMYAACSFAVGTADSLSPITSFARVWTWIAVVVWAIAATGLARSAAGALAVALGRQPRSSRAAG